jgi:DNA-binding MurR/RpiR family transcriptional regulator
MQACLNENTALDGPALLLQIQTRLPELSPIMRSIGRYCVRMHTRLHLMSIDEVSDLCGTVPSSVVRFARLFGHRGFHDFKLAFLDPPSKARDAVNDQAAPRSTLLSSLDEDVYQLSELRLLIEDDAFQIALAWIREQPRLTLTFQGELDRLVAMHLGDALQRLGKCVLLADPCQLRAHQAHRADGQGTCICLDLERPRLHAERSVDAGHLTGFDGHQVHLLGTDRLRGATVSAQQLTLPVFGSTQGRRLQKALSIADTIEAALH